MFYQELYEELGKLFYSMAASDGKVTTAEEMALKDTIRQNWMPLEESTDEYGTDMSALIGFSFDYQDTAMNDTAGIESFSEFFQTNRERFTPAIINNIITTASAIAEAFRKTNTKELEVLCQLDQLFMQHELKK